MGKSIFDRNPITEMFSSVEEAMKCASSKELDSMLKNAFKGITSDPVLGKKNKSKQKMSVVIIADGDDSKLENKENMDYTRMQRYSAGGRKLKQIPSDNKGLQALAKKNPKVVMDMGFDPKVIKGQNAEVPASTNTFVPVDPNAYQSTNTPYKYIPEGVNMVDALVRGTESAEQTDIFGNPRPLVFTRESVGPMNQTEFVKYNALVRDRVKDMNILDEIAEEVEQGVLDAGYVLTHPISNFIEAKKSNIPVEERYPSEQEGGLKYDKNQYFDGPMSPEDIQRVIDETYTALVRKRESNQPLSREELMQFESLSKRVSPHLVRAYSKGGRVFVRKNQNADGTTNVDFVEGLPEIEIGADRGGMGDGTVVSSGFNFDTPKAQRIQNKNIKQILRRSNYTGPQLMGIMANDPELFNAILADTQTKTGVGAVSDLLSARNTAADQTNISGISSVGDVSSSSTSTSTSEVGDVSATGGAGGNVSGIAVGGDNSNQNISTGGSNIRQADGGRPNLGGYPDIPYLFGYKDGGTPNLGGYPDIPYLFGYAVGGAVPVNKQMNANASLYAPSGTNIPNGGMVQNLNVPPMIPLAQEGMMTNNMQEGVNPNDVIDGLMDQVDKLEGQMMLGKITKDDFDAMSTPLLAKIQSIVTQMQKGNNNLFG